MGIPMRIFVSIASAIAIIAIWSVEPPPPITGLGPRQRLFLLLFGGRNSLLPVRPTLTFSLALLNVVIWCGK